MFTLSSNCDVNMFLQLDTKSSVKFHVATYITETIGIPKKKIEKERLPVNCETKLKRHKVFVLKKQTQLQIHNKR